MPTYEVELSWRNAETWEIGADDEDAAVLEAVKRARLSVDAIGDEFELERVEEIAETEF